MRNFLYQLFVFPFVILRYKLLRRVRKHGLLAVPGQPGLFFNCETREYVNIRDF
jgi:hypothetical protein